MRAADIDGTEEATSSLNSAGGRRHSHPDTTTINSNNSNTANEHSSSGLLASLWTKMSEYVELRTLESHPSVSSTDSGRFSGSELFDSGESVNGSAVDRQSVHSAERPVQQRNGHPKEHSQRNSIWNYFFGGGGSSSDSKQSSSASKSKPPSRKNSSSSQDAGHRPRSASYSSPPPPPPSSTNFTRVKESIPTAAETEFAANGTNTWLEWNPLDEDDSDSSDSSSLVASEEEQLHQGTGEGHDFVPVYLNFTWCDQCGGVIWGFRQCLRCTYCKYTCHYKCLNEVRLDCTESPVFKEAQSESPQHTIVAIENGVEDTSSLTGLSREELMWRIEEFNRKADMYPIKLESDSLIFVGSIRIYMNLSRPISIPSGSPLPKACSTLRPYDHSVDHSKRRTSFFLPKNTYEDIQIASESTAIQVIQGVLSHIEVIDNCRKFALFERSDENGEVLMRKLADEEKPLLLRLLWGGDSTTKRYELRENETGQIEWEAFTVPELQNFLRILDKEEQDHIQQVQNKYVVYEKRLRDALNYID
ncbi:ras association domain-containing protein 1-like [Acanthaster planci]|uniref:Ras association domain-containing protein 1-like n=1 Tax=Acanthaster planci TaxID=133434 RepID=A0A8B7XR75_ACAPL|nr:ras association domain-containing protein 1-like [Acanthaster planci]